MPGRNPRRGKEGSENAWNLKEIRELIDVLIDREVTEFEMEKGGVRVHIKRGGTGESAHGPVTPPPAFAASAPVFPSPPPSAPGRALVVRALRAGVLVREHRDRDGSRGGAPARVYGWALHYQVADCRDLL